MRRIAWLVPFVTVLSASPAFAQKVHTFGGAGIARPWASYPGWIGPGPAWGNAPYDTSWRYHNLPDGPYVTSGVGAGLYRGGGPYPMRGVWPWAWGIPGAAGSFWTNGRSLYGPPVPVYGPTPGVFGGSDDNRRFFGNPPPANSIWVGLGWHGYRSPSPRHLTPTVSVHPSTGLVLAPSVQVVPDAPPATTGQGQPCLRLSVRVPDANAEVWIGNTETRQTGTEREFESPPLEAGKAYRYELVAKWTEDGREKAESRTVVGTAGQTVVVDFSRPADVAAR